MLAGVAAGQVSAEVGVLPSVCLVDSCLAFSANGIDNGGIVYYLIEVNNEQSQVRERR